MSELIFPITAGILVMFAWMALWAISLRAFGIPVWQRSPEQRAARKERIRAMGKWRYVLIFGLLGSGMGFGLGIVVLDMISAPHSIGWIRVASKLALSVLVFGLWQGLSNWGQIRGEVPFPPRYPPQK